MESDLWLKYYRLKRMMDALAEMGYCQVATPATIATTKRQKLKNKRLGKDEICRVATSALCPDEVSSIRAERDRADRADHAESLNGSRNVIK